MTATLTGSPESTTQVLPGRSRAPRKKSAGSVRARPLGWNDRWVLVLLGAAATIIGVWNLTGATLYMDDEGTYTAQAFSVLEGDLAPYTYRYDHPPLGWIQLGALAWIPHVLGLGDGTYIGISRYAMVPFFVASTVLVYLIARRLHIRAPFAVLSVAVFLLSPLTLTYGRQVFLDNIGLPWLLLAFWMVLSPRTALWPHVWAGAFFAIAVLSKETLAIFGPALMVALLNRPFWSNRKFSVIGFLVVGGLVLSFYPLMALLSGEFLARQGQVSLQDALVYQFFSRSGSGSLWDPGSGRAELVQDWLFYDQYLIGIGIVAALLCLLRRRTTWIPVALATFAVPVVLGAGYLPAMYIIGALPFLALAIGAALTILWDRLENHLATHGAHRRPWLRGAGAAAIAVGLLLTLAPHWATQNRNLMTADANAEWNAALEWVRNEVPQEDTVVVPYSMWHDLNEVGPNDPWSVVAIEKVDLDSEFLTAHPEGWRDVEWIVVGPQTWETVEHLGLTTARQALRNSEPVHTIGDWSIHRVEGT